jgi:hypothetical protein
MKDLQATKHGYSNMIRRYGDGDTEYTDLKKKQYGDTLSICIKSIK